MDIDKDRLHHAYLVVGEREGSLSVLLSFLEANGILERGSPDFFMYREESFGIKHAREISERALSKALERRKIFIISPGRFTLEAQNALLKTLEEPYPDTHFFIIAREESALIPTLLSRVRVVRTQASREDRESEANAFLGLTLTERIDFARKFSEEERDLPEFLDKLLALLRKEGADRAKLSQVYDLRRFAGDTSAAPRLILEHLALVL